MIRNYYVERFLKPILCSIYENILVIKIMEDVFCTEKKNQQSIDRLGYVCMRLVTTT